MAFAIVAAVVIVTALLLAVPVDIEFDAAWPDTRNNRIDGRWGFGALSFRLDGATAEPKASQPRQAASERARAGKKGSVRVLRALRQRPFRRRLLRFARSLWRAVHKRDVDVSIRIGTGDPAETGQLWGVFGPLSAWLRTSSGCRATIEPDFVAAIARVHGRGRVTIFPLQVLLLASGLMVSPAIWRGIAGRYA